MDIREPKQRDLQCAFRSTLRITLDLLREGDTEIVYADPDTLAVRDWHPWGKYPEFRLFDWNPNDELHIRNDVYWNCSIRYFPAGLSKEWFEQAEFLLKHWNNNVYGYEQYVYWCLMWHQGVMQTVPGQGTIKYNIPPREDWRETIPANAKILHYAASRDPLQVLEDMQCK